MAIVDAFPGASGTVDSVELRKDLAGLVVRDAAGNPRAGVFPRHVNSLLVARSDMKVDVTAFEGVSVRGGGPLFIANDGTATVTLDAAPVANSRIDVVYFKQNEASAPFADANNLPVLGVATGTAAASPTKPSLAAIPGAVELGTVLVPSGVTATNAGGVVITATHQFTTTSGGVLLFRNTTERDLFAVGASSVPVPGQLGYVGGQLFQFIPTATTPGTGWFHVGGVPTLDNVTFSTIYSASGTNPVRLATQGGRLHLEGTVVSTTATFVAGTSYTIGTIPVALAPTAQRTYAVSSNGVLANLSVDAAGTVGFSITVGFTGALALSLGGASWRLKSL